MLFYIPALVDLRNIEIEFLEFLISTFEIFQIIIKYIGKDHLL